MSDEHWSSDTTAWPVFRQSCRKLTPRLYGTIIILAIIGGIWLSLAANVNVSPCFSKSEVFSELAVHDKAQRKQVVIRTTPTNEAGLGSVVAQLRSSAAIATMLDASFATFSLVSTHLTQYRAASLLHIDRLEAPLDTNTTVCSLTVSPYYARILELLETWCNDASLADAHAIELRGFFTNCDLILDDRPWDVRYDMSKCTWKWVKHVFSRLGLKKRVGGIGLHIRWGDMSIATPENDQLVPGRTMPIDNSAQLLRKLRECGVQDELSVYMEWHNTTMLSGLGEPYRIVDSDSLGDLIDLASNRLLILDISSYTILAHQIAEGGITVVPDVDLFGVNWFDNGVNHVLRWNELLSIACSDLSALLDP